VVSAVIHDCQSAKILTHLKVLRAGSSENECEAKDSQGLNWTWKGRASMDDDATFAR
jgi:hypothetical protein